MPTTYQQFMDKTGKIAFDESHRQKMNKSLAHSDHAFKKGISRVGDAEAAKRLANYTKWRAIEHLNELLLQFEENISRKGVKVLWAADAEEAGRMVKQIAQKHQCKSVVKSKSMVTEEIQLNDLLISNGLEVLETDLGEYIQQLAGEAPYHIVAPSLHKSKEEVAELYNRIHHTDPSLAPEEITAVTRSLMRSSFRNADLGITGANFLLADLGGIALTENEGNIRLCSSFPKTHIVITGIEKILPSVKDLALFWPLLSVHGSGQQLTVYNTILTGPKQEAETDGPEHMYVILLDNGRTRLLADPKLRETLFCIRCGACLNVCPIYRNIGGHAYDTTYSGPIGAVISPHLNNFSSYKHLSYASSLCGSCTEVCPVKINLHKLLLYNRRLDNASGKKGEHAIWWGWSWVMKKRSRMDLVPATVKNRVIHRFFRKLWGLKRKLPLFAAKSFAGKSKNHRET